MSEIKPLADSTCMEACSKIASMFGDVSFVAGTYLFDQITKCPAEYAESRVSVTDALSILGRCCSSIRVVFDPHRNNERFRREVAASLGFPDAPGFELSIDAARTVLEKTDCDFYMIGPDFAVLIVGTHEDRVVGSERQLYCLRRAPSLENSGP